MSAPPDKRRLDLALLRAARDGHGRGPVQLLDEVGEALGYHPKVVYRRLEKFQKTGWLEYGVSLRTGWLTAAGLARLACLEAA